MTTAMQVPSGFTYHTPAMGPSSHLPAVSPFASVGQDGTGVTFANLYTAGAAGAAAGVGLGAVAVVAGTVGVAFVGAATPTAGDSVAEDAERSPVTGLGGATSCEAFAVASSDSSWPLLLPSSAISAPTRARSEEHTSELQSLRHLVCR